MNAGLTARLRAWIARVGELFRRRRIRDDLDAELHHHLELEIEYNLSRGMSPADARRAAVIALGGVQRVREDADDARGFVALEAVVRDARYAWRSLRSTKAFTATAALVIALGIAAATSVYGFVDGIFFRALVAGNGDRFVRVFVQRPDGRDDDFSHAAVRLIAQRARSFDLVAEHYSTAPLYVAADEWQAEIQGAVVSADYFPLVGIKPSIGRFFTRDEDAVPGRDAVAVIGESLWQGRFGADPAIVGRTIGINGRPFSIIGVAPASFLGVEPDRNVNQLWIPTAMFRQGYRWCDPLVVQPPCAVSHVVARLAPDATLESAVAEMSAMRKSLLGLSDPGDSLYTVAVERAVGFSPGSRTVYARLTRLLWGIASMLFAIACANLAGLLLVRGLARQREIALRLAIGAGRVQVARQLVIENLMLGALGGGAGVLLSTWGTRILTSFFTVDSEGYRHSLDAHLDLRVLAFAVAASLAAAVLFGSLPAYTATRTDLMDTLKSGGRAGDGHARARHMLVAAQIILSVVLLVGATLLSRSVEGIMSRQRFDAAHVALMRLRPRLVGYDPDKARRYLTEVTRRLESVPGVERVGLAHGVGFVWNSNTTTVVELPGNVGAPAGTAAADAPETIFTTVTPGFFATLGVNLEGGRDFNDRDMPGTPSVTIVNGALARKLWRDATPLGRTVMISGKPFTVVGVVANYRVHNASEPDVPMAFTPFWQDDFEREIDARVAIRVKGDPAPMLPSLAKAAREADPAVPVTELLPMADQVSATFSDVRLARSVLTAAGALALILAGVGLYGVVAFVVARRTREVGIRLAVGARPHEIVALFMRQHLRWALAAVILGAGGAVAAARLISGWLVGVNAFDPASFAAAIVSVFMICVLGTLIPSWRAGRVDPTVALRVD